MLVDSKMHLAVEVPIIHHRLTHSLRSTPDGVSTETNANFTKPKSKTITYLYNAKRPVAWSKAGASEEKAASWWWRRWEVVWWVWSDWIGEHRE